ncbi:MAG: hypothetical protein R3E11_13605 [Sphingobium sp.]|nr:hypothetical protein [Sphingobium sp.]MCP5399435.1 hypothetical protein [Sphingomonas sp.]
MPLDDMMMATLDETAPGPEAGLEVRAVMAVLRERFPGMTLLQCDAADVLEEPWRNWGGIDLHLVDTSNHCVAVTSDPEQATGILLATRQAAS